MNCLSTHPGRNLFISLNYLRAAHPLREDMCEGEPIMQEMALIHCHVQKIFVTFQIKAHGI